MNAIHLGSFSQSQLSLLVDLSRQQADRVSPWDCPFCDSWGEDLKAANLHIQNGENIFVAPEQFRDHVGRHMVQLALFAIPPTFDNDENSDSKCAIKSTQEKPSADTEVESIGSFEEVTAIEPLLFAVKNDLDEEIAHMVQGGISQEHVLIALRDAVANGKISVVKQLLKCPGLDIGSSVEFSSLGLVNGDDGDQHLLLIAASRGHTEIFKLLIDHGAFPDIRGAAGGALLSIAAEIGQIEVVEILLDRGVDIDAADVYGTTVLSFASMEGHIKVVELLVERGADLEKTDSRGCTALTWAMIKDRVDVVELLIKSGANPPLKLPKGDSPLMWAAKRGYTKIVRLLRERDRKLKAKDSQVEPAAPPIDLTSTKSPDTSKTRRKYTRSISDLHEYTSRVASPDGEESKLVSCE
ncbi:Ankyrin-2 [Dactylella cylindrospora]|nr:Ankyrin-2 [Dactylella cylindrospora]